MENNNRYILDWREHVLKAAEALRNHDYETYEAEIGEMENVYDEMRRDEALSYENEDSFGATDAIFESALYNLYLENKPAIKEYMATIKEDKNLHSQFMFFNTLKQCKKDFDKVKYLQEATDLALKGINPKTLRESNKKLRNVLKKYSIKPTSFLDEEDLRFYRLCDTMFASPRSLSNLAKLNETFNQVSELLESRIKIQDEKNEKAMTINEFTSKYNKILTEGEKEFINTLLDSDNDEKRKAMYEEFKSACIKNIESDLKTADSSMKPRLNKLLETVTNKPYNKDTVILDIVKIMEVNELFN